MPTSKVSLRRVVRLLVVGSLALFPIALSAQETGVRPGAVAYGTMFAKWAAEAAVKGGFVVVNRNGRTVHQESVGGADPASPVLLASLSKAVTATCIAKLIQEGRLHWTTPLRGALPSYLQAHGPPADARALDITVEQLVLHRGGFAGRPKDALTTLTLRTFLEKHTAREIEFGPLLAATLRHPLVSAPGELYAYSNAGYLALGAIIEEATKDNYEDACRKRVLAPLGVQNAMLDPSWRVLSSYGGWFMSGADYLRFFEVFAPNNRLLPSDIRAWIANKDGKSMGPQRANWYTLGARIDPIPGGKLIISHTGSWPWTQPVAKDGSLRASTGAFAVRYPDGTSLFAAFWPLPRNIAERDATYNKLVSSMRETNSNLQAGTTTAR